MARLRIERLRLERFRRFEELDLELGPGLNVIRGPNESGKTTILHAIVAGLFFKTSSPGQAVKAAQKWGSEELPAVEMVLEVGGQRYKLRKDFGGRQCVIEAPGDRELRSQKAVDAAVKEMTGLTDAAQYLRTACVGHDELAGLGDRNAGRKLANMLDEIVIGRNETASIESAIATLTTDIDGLRRGMERPALNPGTVKELKDTRTKLIDRQRELAGRSVNLDADSEELSRLEGDLERETARVEEVQSLLAKNTEALSLEARKTRAGETFELASAAGDARKRLDELDIRIEAVDPEGCLNPDDERRLKAIAAEREATTDELSGLEERMAQESRRRPAKPALAVLALGVLLTGLGAWLGTINAALFAVLGVGVALLVLGGYSTWQSSRGRSGLTRFLGERADEIQEKLAGLQDEEKRLLSSAGCEDVESMIEKLQAFKELSAERDRARGAVEATSTTVDASEARKRSAIDAAAAETRLEELSAYRLSPDELERLDRELAGLRARIAENGKLVAKLRTKISASASGAEELLAVEEELSWLWEEEQKARKRLRVSLVALEGMKAARQSMLSTAAPLLAEGVGKTMAALTLGRYDRVEVAPADLSISVYSREKGAMIEADEVLETLSKGAACQLYLAARLELARMLAGGRRMPVVFDDSFTHFDGARLEQLEEILLQAASEWQIILLTCGDSYVRLEGQGARMIDGPGP